MSVLDCELGPDDGFFVTRKHVEIARVVASLDPSGKALQALAESLWGEEDWTLGVLTVYDLLTKHMPQWTVRDALKSYDRRLRDAAGFRTLRDVNSLIASESN